MRENNKGLSQWTNFSKTIAAQKKEQRKACCRSGSYLDGKITNCFREMGYYASVCPQCGYKQVEVITRKSI